MTHTSAARTWRGTTIAAALALAASTLTTPIAAAQDAAQDTVHKEGIGTSPMTLPATTTLGDTTTPHPCAGRRLLYHEHIDSPYVTKNNEGKLAIMAVDNSQVIPSNEMCLRLAPDSYGGKEVSRMVVPDDPHLAFLGKPGTILWHSPFQNYDGWRPLWAGYGAFDSHHEKKVPTDLVGNVVDLAITDFSGPGTMEAFNYIKGWKHARRLLSSKDLRHNTVSIGGHAHMNWTFSKPGIYTITYTATARGFDGKTHSSGPVRQIWLVGDDPDVGLAPGTTIGLDRSGETAEQQRTAMGLDGPQHDWPATTITRTQPLATNEALDSAIDDAFPPSTLDTTISSGTVTGSMAPDEDGYVNQVLTVGGKKLGGSAWVEVPDSNLACIPSDDRYLNGWTSQAGTSLVWATGTDAKTASVSFDTSWANYDELNDQKMLYDFGPSDSNPGQMMVGVNAGGGFAPLTATSIPVSKRVQFLNRGTHPVRFVFSKPGIYRVDATAVGQKKDASFVSGSGGLSFIVGNEAINRWRTSIDPKAPTLPVRADRSCGSNMLNGSDPANYPIGTAHADPAPEPDPQPAPEQPVPSTTVPSPATVPSTTVPSTEETATPAPSTSVSAEPVAADAAPTADELRALWGDAIPTHIVTEGHMDLGLDNEAPGGATKAHLHDEADPANETLRDSGTFAFAVPDRTITTTTALFSGQTGFGDKVYALPQVQIPGLPWVGFSTIDATAPLPGGVTVTLHEFKGPGRLVTGHIGMDGSVDKKLDSADPASKIVYADKAHDHQYWWFDKPGAYKVTLRYAWTDASGAAKTDDLVASFLVGDAAIKAATPLITAASTPQPSASPTPSDSPEPSVTEDPIPSPTPKPHDTPEPSAGSSGPAGIIGVIVLLIAAILPALAMANPQLLALLPAGLPLHR